MGLQHSKVGLSPTSHPLATLLVHFEKNKYKTKALLGTQVQFIAQWCIPTELTTMNEILLKQKMGSTGWIKKTIQSSKCQNPIFFSLVINKT